MGALLLLLLHLAVVGLMHGDPSALRRPTQRLPVLYLPPQHQPQPAASPPKRMQALNIALNNISLVDISLTLNQIIRCGCAGGPALG